MHTTSLALSGLPNSHFSCGEFGLAEVPVTFTKKLENCTVQEQEDVRMEVELSKPSAEVKWMKNSVVVQPGGNLEILVDGVRQTLVLKKVTFADRGYYSCETLDDTTQAKLTVESKSSGGPEAVKQIFALI